jgi:hypothetical protein
VTNEQARNIAEAAITVRDEARELVATEARSGGLQAARDQRKLLSAAEAELNRSIDAAVER